MNWQFDAGHTHIGFTGRHMMVATVRGQFEKFSGTVEFDEHDLIRSKAEIQIEAASVTTHNTQRDEHFRSADFFDVEQYPYITFKSKRVIMQDAHHGQLIGDLTIRNITREVVLEGEYGGVNQTPWNTYSAGFSLRGKVNRKEWGMSWNMVLAGGGLVAGDEITLAIELELTKPAESVAAAQAAEVSARDTSKSI
jgi:polyisoprenoid-binding protein YceI